MTYRWKLLLALLTGCAIGYMLFLIWWSLQLHRAGVYEP